MTEDITSKDINDAMRGLSNRLPSVSFGEGQLPEALHYILPHSYREGKPNPFLALFSAKLASRFPSGIEFTTVDDYTKTRIGTNWGTSSIGIVPRVVDVPWSAMNCLRDTFKGIAQEGFSQTKDFDLTEAGQERMKDAYNHGKHSFDAFINQHFDGPAHLQLVQP